MPRLTSHLRTAFVAPLTMTLALAVLTPPASGQSCGWRKHSGVGPPRRERYATTFDTDRGVTLFYGGRIGPQGNRVGLSDTWTWSGSQWALTATTGPQAGDWGYEMTFDSARGVAVLWGIVGTWEWDGVSWTQIVTTVWPDSWHGHGMVYDSARGVVVVFGGDNNYAGYLGGTWEYDGTDWSLAATTGPQPRFDPSMAYDTARGVTVLHGGSIPYTTDTGTWEWDGSTWTEVDPLGPPTRGTTRLAYDTARGVVVLHGYTRTCNSCPWKSETWEWDGSQWNQVGEDGLPFTDRDLVYDSARNVTIAILGIGEVWNWDGDSWTKVYSTAPSPRVATAMAYDDDLNVGVLFGGVSIDGVVNETWEWDGFWTFRAPATTSPPTRFDHAMAYDAASGATLLFGGRQDNWMSLGDTWTWDHLDWVNVAASGPSPRSKHAMAHDTARGATVLFGGDDGKGGILGDTWEWDGAAWAQVAAGGPSPRFDHAMAFDPLRGVTVLFGGASFDCPSCWPVACPIREPHGTWEWDGFSWTEIDTGVEPPALRDHTMIYDPSREAVVLYGGITPSGLAGGTWAWDGATWTEMGGDGPEPRHGHAGVYDRANDLTLVFGGFDQNNHNGETWMLQAPCTGDVDFDGDVDADDYAMFAGCIQGPGGTVPSGCDVCDLTDDGTVDLEDFASVQSAFTGSLY